MDKKSISECDADADRAIKTMIAGMGVAGVIPAVINIGVAMGAMGVGAVSIGNAYGVALNKEQGGKLVKEFIKSAGLTFLGINVGTQIVSAILQATGIGYFLGAALNGAVAAATGWAVGSCAKEYFRREYLGQNKPSKEELGELFRRTFREKKNNK
ncbi:MAG: DUF697 domain-containing protein [Bacteroidales bacterium]|nr:DUF697 domain-containing protein [Bacteroidales bacterium]